MRVTVAGDGPLALLVARQSVADGHRVTWIGEDRAQADVIATRLGVVAVCGDPSDPAVLEDAEVDEADVFVAVGHADPDNLVACKLARRLGATRVIALVNAPASRVLMAALGFCDVVSGAEVLGTLLRNEAGVHGLMAEIAVRGGALVLVELRLATHSPVIGRAIAHIELPPDVLIVAVLRGETVLVPRGGLVLELDDEVLAICHGPARPQVLAALVGSPA